MSTSLPTSVFGNGVAAMLPFKIAVSTSASSSQSIVPGAYRLSCDVDCWVTVDPTSATAVAPGTTQPSSQSTSRTIRVMAGIPTPFPIEPAWAGNTPFISALALAGTGTLSVEGPLRIENAGL